MSTDLAASPVFTSNYLKIAPQGWSEIEAMLPLAEGIPLQQSWIAEPEPEFRPARARIAWTDQALLVHADLVDEHPFNPMNKFNEPAFSVGDVLEVFIHPVGTEQYVEIHTTPEGALLQLGFPLNWRALAARGEFNSDIYKLGIPTPVSEVLVRHTTDGWEAFLAIPFELIGAKPEIGGVEWTLSICRYDYARGDKHPIISSTSVMPVSDFHLTEYWSPLRFT